MRGRPPLLREFGVLRELSLPPLREGEVKELAIYAIAPQHGATYTDCGMLGFDYAYPHQAGRLFRVVVVRGDGNNEFATLTPITKPTPSHGEHKSKICAVCGYDLRATPGLCPECGTGLEGVA
jgi:hypothetical protein